MAQQKKDLFSQIGNDILKVVVNRIVPKRTSKGRPKKVAWEDRLANGIISSKIALPALGTWVLWNKGAITSEHMAMVMHYVAANQNTISIPSLYPTSPNWIVKKALTEFGLDVSKVDVTWNEMMDLVSQLYQLYEQAKAGQQMPAGQSPSVDEMVQGIGAAMPDIGNLFANMGKSATVPVTKPTVASGKTVDKAGKTE